MTFIPSPANSFLSSGNTSTTNVGGITTLSSGIDAVTTTVPVTDASVFDNNTSIKIDSEYMIITNIVANDLTVTRGAFNSTAATHSISATVRGIYIGTSDINTQPDVMVSLQTNVAGTEYFDFSVDSVNWTTFPTTGFTVSSGIQEFHIAVKGGRYFRLRFETSSSSKSTYFRGYTWYGVFRQGNLPLNQSISDDSDSIVVRSVEMGLDPLGQYSNMKADGSAFRTTSNLQGTTLGGAGLTDSQTGNFTVGSTTGFGSSGYILIDSEFIQYDQVVNGTTLNIPIGGRGAFGTTAAAHSNGSVVGEAYNSGLLQLDGYTQVATKLICSNTGQMRFQWYSDSAGSNTIRTVSSVYSTTNTYDFLSAPNFGPYVRYVFANTQSTATTSFYFETEFYTQSVSAQVLTVNSSITSSMTSNLTRSIISGATNGGQFTNVGVTNSVNPLLKTSIQDPLTSFGQIKVATETPQVQLSFIYGVNPNLTTTSAVNGSASTSNSILSVSSSAAINSYCKLYSKNYIRYKIGQGCKARFTCIFATPATGNTQLIGVGDDTNGFFFGYNGTSFGVLRRSAGVDNWTAQASWNIDTLLGTGSSGMTLNKQLGNVYSISYQWLGFGAITFSVEDEETGIIIPVHLIKYANNFTTPSIIQPTLPMRISSENTTNNTNIVIKTSSMAGYSEGSSEVLGTTYSVSSTGITGVTAQVPILSLRVNTTINSVSAYVRILLEEFTGVGEGTGSNVVRFFLILNPTTLTTPSWVNVDPVNSVTAYDTSATVVSGGTAIGTYVIQRNTGIQVNLRNKNITMFRGDVLTISCSSASSVDPDVAIIWLEENSG